MATPRLFWEETPPCGRHVLESLSWLLFPVIHFSATPSNSLIKAQSFLP